MSDSANPKDDPEPIPPVDSPPPAPKRKDYDSLPFRLDDDHNKQKSSEPERQDYDRLPMLRKSGVCSFIIVSHLIVGIVGRCVPFVGLLGLLTTLGVIAVCISALTGPIYYNKRKKDGTLKTWSWGNKIAAVIILIIFIGGYAALMWFLFASGQFGGTPSTG